jgi:hypothetical protein
VEPLPACPKCRAELKPRMDGHLECPACRKKRKHPGFTVPMSYRPKLPKEIVEAEDDQPPDPDKPGSSG